MQILSVLIPCQISVHTSVQGFSFKRASTMNTHTHTVTHTDFDSVEENNMHDTINVKSDEHLIFGRLT